MYPGKASDPRAAAFLERYPDMVMRNEDGSIMTELAKRGWGKSVVVPVPGQVELDALDPTDLRELYREAIDRWWDPAAHAAALATERDELAILTGWRDSLAG